MNRDHEQIDLEQAERVQEETLLALARSGDIRAFHRLFSEFQPQLKSYLYRLLANRNDMEDMVQDVFITAFENVKSFRGDATLKSWVFTIATNRARRRLKDQKRWTTDTIERTRQMAHAHPEQLEEIYRVNQLSPQGRYEIREHIDYCFTCVSKMLPLRQQIVFILVDIYDFKLSEVSQMLEEGVGAVKHLLHNARQTMLRIYNESCALVNKQGICDQCSQLNGWFNPAQEQQAALMQIQWVKERDQHNRQTLLRLRTLLIREIDPLLTHGADLHELFLRLNQQVNEADV